MEKKKILWMSIFYPLTMSRYFETALRARDDVELTTVGPYTGSFIPWMGGMKLDEKYANKPDIELPVSAGVGKVPWGMVKPLLGGKEFDMVVTCDAGLHFTSRPDVKCPVVHIGTDPHVLAYDLPRSYSDFFFNMQKVYSKPGDIYLPYAFSKHTFFNDKEVKRENDAALIGMPYANRVSWVGQIRSSGFKVAFENGPVFGEYRKLQCSAPVGLSWSSMDDLICRVFELMGMGRIPVINRVTDLEEHFVEGEHYVAFDNNLRSAVEVATEVMRNPDKYKHIAEKAEKWAWEKHTFDKRVETILSTVLGE